MYLCCPDTDGRLALGVDVRNDGVGLDTRVASQPITAQEIALRTELDFVRHRGVC